VTSGLGGAFPAGYPVAVVDNVNRVPQEPFAHVTAVPTSALDKVREVLLIWSADAANDQQDAGPESDDE
jgi:rod shape-determining protein MreC